MNEIEREEGKDKREGREGEGRGGEVETQVERPKKSVRGSEQ